MTATTADQRTEATSSTSALYLLSPHLHLAAISLEFCLAADTQVGVNREQFSELKREKAVGQAFSTINHQ